MWSTRWVRVVVWFTLAVFGSLYGVLFEFSGVFLREGGWVFFCWIAMIAAVGVFHWMATLDFCWYGMILRQGITPSEEIKMLRLNELSPEYIKIRDARFIIFFLLAPAESLLTLRLDLINGRILPIGYVFFVIVTTIGLVESDIWEGKKRRRLAATEGNP
ncbi:MAG TPA: hypothetical protein VJB99_01030 [Patescibacteria group bacterium]|nr:hypothetical protein [Patescibacteria group bacterium]